MNNIQSSTRPLSMSSSYPPRDPSQTSPLPPPSRLITTHNSDALAVFHPTSGITPWQVMAPRTFSSCSSHRLVFLLSSIFSLYACIYLYSVPVDLIRMFMAFAQYLALCYGHILLDVFRHYTSPHNFLTPYNP